MTAWPKLACEVPISCMWSPNVVAAYEKFSCVAMTRAAPSCFKLDALLKYLSFISSGIGRVILTVFASDFQQNLSENQQGWTGRTSVKPGTLRNQFSCVMLSHSPLQVHPFSLSLTFRDAVPISQWIFHYIPSGWDLTGWPPTRVL